MDTKLFIVLASSSFGLILLGAVIGNVLESHGLLTRENLGFRGTLIVLCFFFSLLCLLTFSLVPVFVKAFIALQIRIGNGGRLLIQWIRAHERALVYGIWGFFGTGLIIAFALARDEIMKHLP